VLGDGLVELRDLVALGRVGVEVVLAREDAGLADLAVDGLGREHGELDAFAVEHRQRAGQAEADGADVGVGLAAVLVDAAAEGLGLGEQLDVDFEADDGLVLGEDFRRPRCGSWRAGLAKLVIAPVEAACMRLFSRDYYAALALRLRVGEEHLPDMLVEHLLSVGYTRVDVVEMPGQVSMRGGILDVYGPEMERPVRIDFFGDEIESMRRFDPETQRSSSAVDEVLLLPLTETPATEALLTAINARLTRSGVAGAELEGGETPRSW
jgi:hypothetical protein